MVLATVCLAVAVGSAYLAVNGLPAKRQAGTTQQLYQAAVDDAVFAEEAEILPLVNIEKTNNKVTWNEAGDRVLLLSWHQYPDSYPTGEEIVFEWGEVWAFTEKEMVQWYKDNKNGVNDWTLRLEQLIGLPPKTGHTHFSALWVKPEDLVRPAYVTDATSPMALATLEAEERAADFDIWYKDWFDGNILWSYFDSQYPWTRLGYTYDWADNQTEYGLSEFLVLQDASAVVEFTLTNEEFVAWLANQP